jgi:hypothetical protein
MSNKIAAGNAGWPVQFRFAVHAFWSRAPELWTFGQFIMKRVLLLLLGVLLLAEHRAFCDEAGDCFNRGNENF